MGAINVDNMHIDGTHAPKGMQGFMVNVLILKVGT